GAECPVESIVVWNRTDGNLGTRLKDYTLKVLDGNRAVVFEKVKQPTPPVKASFEVGTESPERRVRRAAMLALTGVRGKEADAFKTIARYVKDDADRPAAVQALLRVPAAHWPKEEADPLLASLLAYVRKVPASERTAPAVLDALQLAD